MSEFVDGLGDRHQQVVDGVTTNYILDLAAGLPQVLDDGTNTYLYGNGRIAQAGSTAEYFLSDALGSVRQLADPAGAVTLTQSYAPYGDVVSSVGTSQTSYAFTGEALDANGLTYLRARYYAPQDGRFISRDTWAGNYSNPLSLNRWNYVEGNPINWVDPSGYIKQGQEDIAAQAILNNLKLYNVTIVKDWGDISSNTYALLDVHLLTSCGWQDGNWKLQELEAVQDAIIIMSRGVSTLGGNFNSLIGHATIIREKSSKRASAYRQVITFTDPRSQAHSLYRTIHEMGHVVHQNNRQALFYFMDELGTVCTDLTGKEATYCHQNGVAGGLYDPNSQYMPTDNSKDGNMEDFSDTFTLVVTQAYIRSGGSKIAEATLVFDQFIQGGGTIHIGKRRTIMEKIIDGSWK